MLWLLVTMVLQVFLIAEKIADWADYSPNPFTSIQPMASTSVSQINPDGSEKNVFVGECRADVFYAGVSVFLPKTINGGGTQGMMMMTMGDKSVHNAAIIISKDNKTGYVDVISHEVSHFVDRIIESRGLEGTEVRAYLQGYLTNCVTNLVKSKI